MKPGILDTSPPKQFFASRRNEELPKGYKHKTIGDWNIYISNDVPCIEVVNEDSNKVGLLIGWIVGDDGVFESGTQFLLPRDGIGLPLPFRRFWGRYLYFSVAGKDTYVTTDAGALFPLVFHASEGIIASSPSIIAAVAPITRDEALAGKYDLRKRHGWYPFGLTPYKEVNRLLPNHSLNLSTWESKRLWPAPETVLFSPEHERSGQKAVLELAELIRDRVQSVANQRNFRVHLTAGFDTRMLLATCRNVLNHVVFQTYDLPASTAKLDCHVAAQLVRKFSLDHKFLPYSEASDSEHGNWLWRTGFCVNDNVTRMARMEKANFDGSITLAGISGEVGRAFYWNKEDIGASNITPANLLHRLRIPEIEPFLSAAEGWMSNLPSGSVPWILDLAYIELRLGCWAGAAMPGHDVPHPTLSPFNSVDCYELMLSLDYIYRADQRMCVDFITHLWPELLQVPVNRAIGFHKLFFPKKELTLLLPKTLKQGLKKLFSK